MLPELTPCVMNFGAGFPCNHGGTSNGIPVSLNVWCVRVVGVNI